MDKNIKMSKVICSRPGCMKRIKMKLIEARKRSNANRCYAHYCEDEDRRDHYINAKRRTSK